MSFFSLSSVYTSLSLLLPHIYIHSIWFCNRAEQRNMQRNMENNTPSFNFHFRHPNSSPSSSWDAGGGMSFQSLLTTNFDDKTLLPLLGFSPPTTTTTTTPTTTTNDFIPIQHPPFNNNHNHLSYNQLPHLCSLDNVVEYNSNLLAPTPTDSSSSSSSSRKRQHLNSLSPDIHRLSVAQQRSHKFREKINYLHSLLPPSPNNNKKMAMATILEEAYKYVKFLQAQLRILKAMPQFSDDVLSSSSSSRNVVDVFGGGGGLGRLNRNQLLQVLINSPAAQSIMYSNGLCVFSAEQLPLLKHLIAVFFAACC